MISISASILTYPVQNTVNVGVSYLMRNFWLFLKNIDTFLHEMQIAQGNQCLLIYEMDGLLFYIPGFSFLILQWINKNFYFEISPSNCHFVYFNLILNPWGNEGDDEGTIPYLKYMEFFYLKLYRLLFLSSAVMWEQEKLEYKRYITKSDPTRWALFYLFCFVLFCVWVLKKRTWHPFMEVERAELLVFVPKVTKGICLLSSQIGSLNNSEYVLNKTTQLVILNWW